MGPRSARVWPHAGNEGASIADKSSYARGSIPRAEEVAHMNPVSRVRQSYALRLATGGVLLLALVLAPGLGGRFGPTPAGTVQARGVLASAPGGQSGPVQYPGLPPRFGPDPVRYTP